MYIKLAQNGTSLYSERPPTEARDCVCDGGDPARALAALPGAGGRQPGARDRMRTRQRRTNVGRN